MTLEFMAPDPSQLALYRRRILSNGLSAWMRAMGLHPNGEGK